MKILIVNAYEEENRGIESYGIYRELIISVFTKCRIVGIEYVERRLDNLSEFILDWEHDNLDDSSQIYAKNFDKFDFVFIGGDMKICPWEPIATQVVTLIHMCKRSKKPLFANGFGAFSVVYSLATKGARFHILNGPEGETIERLPTFPRYSIGNGAYPSGWLDNETGDIYTFNSGSRSWQPVCNIGVFHSASSGAPPSDRVRKVLKKFAREDHVLAFRQRVEALAVGEDVVHIRNQLFQHKAVRSLEAQNFVAKPLPNWYLNADGALPSGEGLFVIADGSQGPVLLCKENMLLLTSKIDKSACYASIKTIIASFVESMLWGIKSCAGDKHSLSSFLFGADGRSGTYDTVKHRETMTPALASKPIATALPPGQPVKVDPPVISMFFAHKSGKDEYAPHESSVGIIRAKPRVTVQNPLSVRTERLQLLTTRAGYNLNGSMTAVIDRAVALSSRERPGEAQDLMPEEVRELFTGRIMKDSSVSTRRHHMLNHGDFKEVVYFEAFYSGQLDIQPTTGPTGPGALGVPAARKSIALMNRKSLPLVKNQPTGGDMQTEEPESDELVAMPEFEDILAECISFYPFTGGVNTVLWERDDAEDSAADALAQSPSGRRLIVSEPAPVSTDPLSGGSSHLSHRQIKTAVPYDHAANFPKPDTPPTSVPSKVKSRTHRKHHSTRSRSPTLVPEITDWHKAVTPGSDAHNPPLTSQSARGVSGNRQNSAHGKRQPPPLGVGPDSDRQFTDYVIHTARSARTADSIDSALSELYLPVKHPKPMKGYAAPEEGSFSASSSAWEDSELPALSQSSLYTSSQYSSNFLNETRVVLPTPKSGPYSSYKTLAKTIKASNAAFNSAEYGSYYTVPYVPESQRPLKEYAESKKKFVGGPFLTSFGAANSLMQPGKEGLVRGQGPYPTEPLPGMPEGITAADWAFLKHNEANKNIAGAWKN